MRQLQLLSAWLFNYVGSTRSAALIRIGFAILIAYRFGLQHPSIPAHGPLLSAVFWLSCIGLLVGFWSRICALVVGSLSLSTYYYLFLLHGSKAWDHHHTYLLAFATITLALAPCGRSYSVDRWLLERKADREGLPRPTEFGNLFALRLLAIQLATLYFFAFWDKVFIENPSDIFWNFLNGSRLEAILMWHYWGASFHIEPWMSAIASALSVTVCILELILPLLLVERLVKWLIGPAVVMHIMFYVMLPLQTYSLTCMLIWLAAFNADKVHRWIDYLSPEGERAALPV